MKDAEAEAGADEDLSLNHNLCDVEEPEIHGDMVANNGLIIKAQDFIARVCPVKTF